MKAGAAVTPRCKQREQERLGEAESARIKLLMSTQTTGKSNTEISV